MITIQNNFPLQNSLKLESKAKYFAEIESVEDFLEAHSFAKKNNLPLITLGEGSNVILANALNAMVVRWASTSISILEKSENYTLVKADAGVRLDDFLKFCLENKFYGLENLVSIPGSVGSSCMQNVGAYGVQVSDCIEYVEVMIDDTLEKFYKDRCQFSYRTSVFKKMTDISIYSVCFKLSNNPQPKAEYQSLKDYLTSHSLSATPENIYTSIKTIRKDRLPNPALTPNAGSFFINPYIEKSALDTILISYPNIKYTQENGKYKLLAASILETLGFKGLNDPTNSVGISPQHALVMINYKATNADILLDFAKTIQEKVNISLGINLEIEPVIFR